MIDDAISDAHLKIIEIVHALFIDLRRLTDELRHRSRDRWYRQSPASTEFRGNGKNTAVFLKISPRPAENLGRSIVSLIRLRCPCKGMKDQRTLHGFI